MRYNFRWHHAFVISASSMGLILIVKDVTPTPSALRFHVFSYLKGRDFIPGAFTSTKAI
jgi:hypothetical protein